MKILLFIVILILVIFIIYSFQKKKPKTCILSHEFDYLTECKVPFFCGGTQTVKHKVIKDDKNCNNPEFEIICNKCKDPRLPGFSQKDCAPGYTFNPNGTGIVKDGKVIDVPTCEYICKDGSKPVMYYAEKQEDKDNGYWFCKEDTERKNPIYYMDVDGTYHKKLFAYNYI